MNWRERIEPIVRPLIHIWWRFQRGTTLGVRGIVEDEHGRVVLVRHTYVGGWHLPGGGVERGETIDFAMNRELAEEVGVELLEPAELLGAYANHAHFRGDHVMVLKARSWQSCATDNEGEIAEVSWFSPDALPDEVSPGTGRRLAEYYGKAETSTDW
jgi:ADP-ribose pyrophosphatase YjhB (NUDIX family)